MASPSSAHSRTRYARIWYLHIRSLSQAGNGTVKRENPVIRVIQLFPPEQRCCCS